MQNPSMKLHGKIVTAKVVSIRCDLYGMNVTVMTSEAGLLQSNLHRYDADKLSVGQDVQVQLYCTNLIMPLLFNLTRE